MTQRYFIELFQPESHDELQTFHQTIIQAIHDQSERFDDPFSDAKYRSWIGLSYPLFGQLELHERAEIARDANYRLHYAIKHPGKFLGNVVHCVSAEAKKLEYLLCSGSFSLLFDDSCLVSDIKPVPYDSKEAIYKRGRRVERRSKKYRTKLSKRTFNIGSLRLSFNPSSFNEPTPGIANFSSNKRRKPIHISMRSSDKPVDGWYSMYGLSRRQSSVPLIPVQNTLFFEP